MKMRLLAALLFLAAASRAWADPVAVPTYHNDNLRTGWNNQESLLTPETVRRGSFGRLAVVTLDDQVDAQPLYVPNVAIPGVGTRNVIYVATERNTVYAVDADSGAILLSRNLGQAVPRKLLPGGCSTGGNRLGIAGTPVIDLARQTIYVLAHGLERKVQVYRLHALALDTLADKVPPTLAAGAQALTNHTIFNFSAFYNRNRAGLVEANGNIYAAFTSFCDFDPDPTRGWVLGWQADTLSLLPTQRLLNRLATQTNNYFLDTVWMSGSAIAADANGSLYFVTGNSAPSGTTYQAYNNLSESVVKLSPDLTKVQGYFTPSNPDVLTLDHQDKDFGSGGIMLLPPQPQTGVRLAVAAGKIGLMYLMRQGDLGGHAKSGDPDNVLGSYQIGPCFCVESYFTGADGMGRVVSSGGQNVIVWKVGGGPAPALTQESISAVLPTGQDSGFFTSVTSNGTAAASQVIWAVTRPVHRAKPPIVSLYAIDPSTVEAGQSKTLFSAIAGTWPHTFANSNIVPLAVNGRVYVASYKKLLIFGPGASPEKTASLAELTDGEETADSDDATGSVLTGTVLSIDKASLKLRTRTQRVITVDTRPATRAHLSVPLATGAPLTVRGAYKADGVLEAEAIMRAKSSPDLWEDDR